jgi:hypothetical protein
VSLEGGGTVSTIAGGCRTTMSAWFGPLVEQPAVNTAAAPSQYAAHFSVFLKDRPDLIDKYGHFPQTGSMLKRHAPTGQP